MAIARREALILGVVGAAAAVGGAVVGALALQSRSGAAELLSTRFLDLAGQPRRLIDWQGRAMLCNFWATWCAPCREEIPLLVAAKQYLGSGLAEIVGIGIDSADKIREFAAKMQINYPLLVADATAIELLRRLGNRAGGLPFTVVVEPRGAISYRHLGPLTQSELRQVVESFAG